TSSLQRARGPRGEPARAAPSAPPPAWPKLLDGQKPGMHAASRAGPARRRPPSTGQGDKTFRSKAGEKSCLSFPHRINFFRKDPLSPSLKGGCQKLTEVPRYAVPFLFEEGAYTSSEVCGAERAPQH